MRRLFAISLALATACSTAGTGGPCRSDAECQGGAVCIATDRMGASVCMAPCAEGTRLCGDGSVCLVEPGGQSVCYLGGHGAYGDPCRTSLECEPGTVCSEEHGACLQACTVPIACPCRADEICAGPSRLEGICVARPDAGPMDAGGIDAPLDAGPVVGCRCSSDGECTGGAVCVATGAENLALCMAPCSGAPDGCTDGAACLDIDGRSVCYLGGDRPAGSACTSDRECATGTICSAEHSTCLPTCTVGAACQCGGAGVCEATSGPSGVCAPGADAGAIDAGCP